MSNAGRSRAAVFFDRDGVINELVPDPISGECESPLAARDVVLVGGVLPAVARLREAGFMLIGVSNQPAAAKGKVAPQDLFDVQGRVTELLGAGQVKFDAFELCLHHPEGVVPELTGDCACRKPAPGMLLAVAARLNINLSSSWMVGDTDADIAAGESAGCRTVLVENPGSAHKRLGEAVPTTLASDVAVAARLILANTSGA